jgi:tRNA(Ile)-lysidine synthase
MAILELLREQFLTEPLASQPSIVVAYSGGVDSHVLLHALSKLEQDPNYNFTLSAIHIHHGLSANADQWQIHCREVCAQLQVPFQTANLGIIKLPQNSLEAQARTGRYQKLTELAPANSQVVVAQHQEDQLETFLLQLKRGAGPKGLSAMNQAWSLSCALQPQKIVGFCRPLLDISQQYILDYAQQNQLVWCEDESNQNINFERNFLRQDVLPILLQRWPEITKSVVRSAALCAEQQLLLNEVCADKLASLVASVNSLHLPKLQQLSLPWLHQLIRYWLSQLAIQSPSLAVLSQLKPQVFDASDDATPILQWQGWQFRRFDQQLFVIKTPARKAIFNRVWQGESSIELPNDLALLTFTHVAENPNEDKLVLKVDHQLGPVFVRVGGYSTRFKPLNSRHSKPIKQWFKQWKIAPWLRESAVLIIQNERVLGVWVSGHWRHGQINETQSNTDNWLLKIVENSA